MAARPSSRRGAIATRPTPYVAGRQREMRLRHRAHEIERPRFAVGVEPLQDVVEEQLARAMKRRNCGS